MIRRSALLALLAAAGYLGLFSAQTILTRTYFTLPQPGGNDFYPRWAGGCLWLREGVNPYSPAATGAIQQGMYGRAAQPGEDEAAYAYPIYTVLFTSPFCLTTDFSWARAAWMTASIHLLLVGTMLTRTLTSWRPSWRLWPWVLAWSVLVYPNARALLLGQLSVLVFVLIIGALKALRSGWDFAAGVLLALSTVKPQMVLLVIPWLLLWAVWRKRWTVPVGFGVSMAALAGFPLIVLPSWPVDFLAQLSRYTSYTELGSLTWIVTDYYLGLPRAVEWAVSLGLMAWMAWEWHRSRRFAFEPMLWTASLALVVTHFVAPRTATTHFAPLLLPLFLGFSLLQRERPDRADLVAALTLAAVFVGMWWLFTATVHGRQESALTYLPIPAILLLLLPRLRRRWVETSSMAL